MTVLQVMFTAMSRPCSAAILSGGLDHAGPVYFIPSIYGARSSAVFVRRRLAMSSWCPGRRLWAWHRQMDA